MTTPVNSAKLNFQQTIQAAAEKAQPEQITVITAKTVPVGLNHPNRYMVNFGYGSKNASVHFGGSAQILETLEKLLPETMRCHFMKIDEECRPSHFNKILKTLKSLHTPNSLRKFFTGSKEEALKTDCLAHLSSRLLELNEKFRFNKCGELIKEIDNLSEPENKEKLIKAIASAIRNSIVDVKDNVTDAATRQSVLKNLGSLFEDLDAKTLQLPEHQQKEISHFIESNRKYLNLSEEQAAEAAALLKPHKPLNPATDLYSNPALALPTDLLEVNHSQINVITNHSFAFMPKEHRNEHFVKVLDWVTKMPEKQENLKVEGLVNLFNNLHLVDLKTCTITWETMYKELNKLTNPENVQKLIIMLSTNIKIMPEGNQAQLFISLCEKAQKLPPKNRQCANQSLLVTINKLTQPVQTSLKNTAPELMEVVKSSR